jgi:Cu2+-exporting ATPase
VKRLGLPVLGLVLSAAASAALWIPRLLVGGVVLAAAIPSFRRMLQGVRDEHRLPVEFLDSLTIVLLTLQGSFIAPAFAVGVSEGSEIVRDWTARRKKQATLDLLLSRDRQVLVERNGQEMSISWHFIEIDDVIHVYPGDQVPADGVVLEGSGLMYTSEDAVADKIESGKLEIVLNQFAPKSAGYYLYYPQRSQVQPKLRAFIDHIKKPRVPQ